MKTHFLKSSTIVAAIAIFASTQTAIFAAAQHPAAVQQPAASPHKYAVKTINGVPQIFEDDTPIRPRMFYGRHGSTSEKIGAKWKTCTFEFTAPFDCAPCAIHFRFRKDNIKIKIAEIKVENLSTNKTEKSLNTAADTPDPDMTFWCEGMRSPTLPLEIKNAKTKKGTTYLSVNKQPDAKHPMGGFHLLYTNLSVKKGNTYRVKIKMKTDSETFTNIGFRKQFGDYRLFGGLGHNSLTYQTKLAAQAGVDFVTFPIKPPFTEDGQTPDFTEIALTYNEILEANPKAKLIPRVKLAAPESWTKKHPTELMRYENGKTDPFNASISSPAYRAACLRALEQLIDFSEKHYAANMAGYHYTGGNTNEWFYPNTWLPLLSGYDTSTLKAWRDWLKRKYKTDSALQRAWNAPSAAIDTAQVPSAQRRRQAGALVDPKTEADIFDFNLFLQDEMSDIVLMLADKVRSRVPDRLCVVFYGYGFEFSSVGNSPAVSGHYALGKILKSKSIDIICGPISYFDRQFGGGKTTMGATETITRSGKIWLDEDDTSTHLASKNGTYAGLDKSIDTAEKSVKILRRNLAQEFVRNNASWLMDLGGGGWFAAPELWQPLKTLAPLEAAYIKAPSPYEPPVALIYDEPSLCLIGGNSISSKTSLKSLRFARRELNRASVPFGHYLLSDIIKNPPKSKINVFAGVYALTAADRAALKKQTADTVNIWVWQPAYVDLDKREFSAEATRFLTGFDVRPAPAATRAIATPTPDGVRTRLPDKIGSGIQIPLLIPETKRGDTILATFEDGSPAIVVRGNNIFCSLPDIPNRLVRYAARRANVHTYCWLPAAVYRNGEYLALTATVDGLHKIDLGGTYKVSEVFDGTSFGTTDTLQLDLKHGDAKLLRLTPAVPKK